MESLLYKDKKSQNKATLGLLPHYFKKIGIVIMVLAFIPAIFVKLQNIEVATHQRETLKVLTLNVFILGLLFVAWAKDITEDEMTVHLRFKSLGFAFVCTVSYVIIQPIIDLILKDPIVDLKAQGLVLIMLFIYLIF